MIYKICPRDRKGERDANTWYTEDIVKAARAVCDGHEVFLSKVENGVIGWQPAEVAVQSKQKGL